MDTVTVVIVIVVLLVGAGAAAFFFLRSRSAHLQQRFGPEYERAVRETDSRLSAERDLAQRERRRSQLEITPLPDSAAARYREEWASIQQRFVDEPAEAVQDADRLVVRMMRESGYPVDDFEQRADDVSVDHPQVAQHYRDGHAVAVAQSRGAADTEELRQAVTSYRHLVDALLQPRTSGDAARSEGSTE